MSIQIMILGDTVPTVSNIELFDGLHTEELIGETIYKEIKHSDYIISNLEVPLTDNYTPIEKCGPCLKAPARTIKGLKAINPYFYNLANNHILDHGIDGLSSTIKLLSNEGIQYAGAGKNLEAAAQPSFFCKDGIKIGIYCCCQHEFSSATQTTPGANAYDADVSNEQIRKIRAECDFLIVLYHGGIEHYRLPSPGLQSACRSMVNHGADMVICQHSHCVGAEENWKHGVIIYGQGDFLFDYQDNEYRESGLIILLILDYSKKTINKKITYLPIVKSGNSVRIADSNKKNDIIEGFKERSRFTSNDNDIKDRFLEHSKDKIIDYLFYLYAGKRHPALRIVNKLLKGKFYGWFLKKYYKKEDLLRIVNIIECEAHREVILAGLKEMINMY